MGGRHPIHGISRRFLLAAGAVALLPGWAHAQGQGTPSQGTPGQATPAQATPGQGTPSQAGPNRMDQASVTALIQDWPQEARAAAEEMLRKYGAPQEASPTRLLWEANRPWIRTIVYKTGTPHDFPARHVDVLEQVAPYRVPLNFFEPIATFNGSVVPNRTRGELSTQGDREATNILALNLAHDIIRGHRTVTQAREAMAEGVREIQEGRVPRDAQELRLGPPQGDLRDPDTAVIQPAPGQGAGTSPAVIR
ncbi:hypothetical protein J8J14_08560 [Roseomonas sp. SSH11]|uniref:Uncharacterized protein n=1 Tax=Pararoseomonas baculiformis TaxID=2820812 RepID=A0ABS4AF02_9PROT|nr:hypothetical protein [Pararoseomonas baculiformis]MBP0444834.1 hypothetical protein [Pararoseomonas baculiformis]